MKKVLVLFGGNSSEHYISCKSAYGILNNIDRKLFSVTPVLIDFNDDWFIFNDDFAYLDNGNWQDAKLILIENIINFIKNFDVVFPVLHGRNGEDGRIQGMLDLFQVKYVGCDCLSSSIAMDKSIAKLFFNSLDIPQVPYMIMDKLNTKSVIKNLGFPIIIKPANGGSSIGINKANNKRELIRYFNEARKFDDIIILEKFVCFRELECAVMEDNGVILSKIGEIKNSRDFYDFDSKYNTNDSTTLIASDLSSVIENTIHEYSLKIFKGLHCRGLSRIDFFYDDINNCVYINEINTMPGFTPISMFPTLIMNEGYSYKQIITNLINHS